MHEEFLIKCLNCHRYFEPIKNTAFCSKTYEKEYYEKLRGSTLKSNIVGESRAEKVMREMRDI